MYTIDTTYTYQQVIKKSIFICYLIPIKSIDDANEILKQMRKKYYDATHCCYSYRLNENIIKASDDGEPSQTAGVVILDVLQKNSLTNLIAIVIRYFGGIKLGAGGLVRAYSSTTSETVKLCQLKKIEKKIKIKLTFSYEYVNEVQKVCNKYEKIKQDFSQNVILIYEIPLNDINELKTKLIEITKNSLLFEEIN